MYFDRNIDLSEKIRMAKKNEGSYLSCVTNGEFHFTSSKAPKTATSGAKYDNFDGPD